MGIIILVLVFVVLAILGWILDHIFYNDNWGLLKVIFTLIGGCSILIIALYSINLENRFEIIMANHYSLKEIVGVSRDSMSEFERVSLINEIQENNKVINEHRIMHNNFWNGIWYSEKIGKLELLK